MERVVFLIERTGERVSCLLNPESVVIRRRAGLRRRDGGVAALTRADDELLYTGGGVTELTLDLLFDVGLVGRGAGGLPGQGTPPADGTPLVDDVRTLTAPLLKLAESARDTSDLPWPPHLRFVWGKAWNMAVAITAAAERVDRFTSTGVPQRSWLRLGLVRVGEAGTAADAAAVPAAPASETVARLAADAGSAPSGVVHVVAGAVAGAAGEVERIDLLAWRLLGHPALWRVLVAANPDIEDPAALSVGQSLAVPDLRLGVGR